MNLKALPDVIGFYLPGDRRDDWTGKIPTGKIDRATGEVIMEKEKSMTKQSFKEECDINNIVKKFEATGQIDHINQAAAKGLFVDLPDGLDLQAGLNMIAQAEGAFMALPAAVRAQFDNDPVKFVEAFNHPTPEFQEQLIKLGLATDARPPTPAKPDAPASPPAGGTGGGEKPPSGDKKP